MEGVGGEGQREGERPFVGFQVVSHEKPGYTPRLPPPATRVSPASAGPTWVSVWLPPRSPGMHR